jgi:replicative DNA helicase
MAIAESFLISRYNNLKKRQRYLRSVREEAPALPAASVKKGQWRAEEDIISILLRNDNEISKYIFEHISMEDFANEPMKAIFEILVHQWEEMGHFDLKILEKSVATNEEMNIISRLSLQTIEQPQKYAAGCIYKMRKWNLDSRYNEILRLMKEESNSAKSKSHYTRELTKIRQRISEIENEYKKIFTLDL